MKVENLEPLEPGNPFLSDAYHMGTKIGRNVHVMFDRFPEDIHKYIIVVNTETGERIKIHL